MSRRPKEVAIASSIEANFEPIEEPSPAGGRYSTANKKKAMGSSYTPEPLARFVASEVAKAHRAISKTVIRVFDPAVGDGELLVWLVCELFDQHYQHIHVEGYDTDPEALAVAKGRLRQIAPEQLLSIKFHCEDFLDQVLSDHSPNRQTNLFAVPIDTFVPDVVIANPPYVRTQVLGASKAQQLARAFGLKGRVDLYHAFVLGIAARLRSGGTLGIIVSNRFMTTRGGGSVRTCFLHNYRLLGVWDMGDTKLFEEAVLPAVIVGERSDNGTAGERVPFTSTYAASNLETSVEANHVLDGLSDRQSGVIRVKGQVFKIVSGRLEHKGDPHGVWRVGTKDVDEWLRVVEEHRAYQFGDVGKIRVGVKTTADNVFIRSDWDSLPSEIRPEEELLRPLLTHKQTRRWRASSVISAMSILYTHTVRDGKRVPISLDSYPGAKGYLQQHRNTLERRHYVIDAGRNWYELWVPHDPTLWEQPKLVFRDIAEESEFLVDLNGHVINGDCYWMVAESPRMEDLLWLAMGVGNSSFIAKFYDHRFHNKLYAGRRRFMSQYVRQFPLPRPDTVYAQKLVKLVRALYEDRGSFEDKQLLEQQKEVDELVYRSFGLTEEITR